MVVDLRVTAGCPYALSPKRPAPMSGSSWTSWAWRRKHTMGHQADGGLRDPCTACDAQRVAKLAIARVGSKPREKWRLQEVNRSNIASSISPIQPCECLVGLAAKGVDRCDEIGREFL